MNDFLSTVDGFEVNSKRVVFRALANSAIFRLFTAIDAMEALDARMEDEIPAGRDPMFSADMERDGELREKAVKLRRLYNTGSAFLRLSGGGKFWEPMDGQTVLGLAGTVRDAAIDLSLLAEITGKSVEELSKLQKAVLIAEARKGQAKVSRSGDRFLNFLEHDVEDVTEYVEDLLDDLGMDGRDIAVRALKKAMDRALNNALKGDRSGLSDLIFYKDAIYALS